MEETIKAYGLKTKNMKKLIMLFLLISSLSFGQSKVSSSVAVTQNVTSLNDGMSLGVQFEYVNNVLYVGPEVYVFPNLDDLSYAHIIGRMGFNLFFDRFGQWRAHAGPRLGGIYRANRMHALLGAEVGLDYSFYNSPIYIGVAGISDMKADSKAYSNEESHTVNTASIRVGYKF